MTSRDQPLNESPPARRGAAGSEISSTCSPVHRTKNLKGPNEGAGDSAPHLRGESQKSCGKIIRWEQRPLPPLRLPPRSRVLPSLAIAVLEDNRSLEDARGVACEAVQEVGADKAA